MLDFEQENIIICEDTQEGVFTGIYRAYEWKMKPEQTILQTGEYNDLRLFAGYRTVDTDPECAEKVMRTIRRRFGLECCEQICSALASEAEDKGQAVYQTIAEGLNGKIKGKLMNHLGNPYVRRTFELSRAVGNETHHLLGFTRFEETENGILFAEIHPKNRVLPFLMPHFADRFPGENFVIRDRSRNLYGIHQAHREWFLAKIENGPEKSRLKFTEEERRIQELFRYFTQKIMIEERENRNLQRQMLPLRFRPDMTEFAQKIQADNSMMDRGCSDRYVDI